MHKKTICVVVAWLMVVATLGSAQVGARLGARFSEAYEAFAPLYSLHRSYADHLFSGTEVTVPPGIDAACAVFAQSLAQLQIDLVTQTASDTVESIAYLVRLRSDAAAFCDGYAPFIDQLEAIGEDLKAALQTASDAGLFAEIKRLNDQFEIVLDAALGGFTDPAGRWDFGVTFACRTLVGLPRIERVDESLREIIYGSATSDSIPFSVPDEIADAMQDLVGLIGRTLSGEEAAVAKDASTRIFEYMTSS